ncbi:MAG TPA: NADH-quinone oxidoreductase subunit NuoN [Burkholderiales bacterium]|jgi:NADH-quinone oxidoreductase subunit N|nr:NADH-quinone oxidoreductase subunit NuoN [Burkholderiales bacterium]
MTLLTVLSHARALPEALLLLGACVAMIADSFVKDERRALTYWISQGTLALCAAATLFVVSQTGAEKYYLFNGLFVADFLSHLIKLVFYASVSATLVYSRQWLLDRGLLRGEFFSLLLFSLLGMMLLASANSFLTVFLGLELMSLCLYALVALNRDSALATEAAMKYFVLGALSSGLLLYGMSMIYGATGTLAIPDVAASVGALASRDHNFLVFGLVFVVAGVAFKLGVVPFHMWIPDVYHGAPTPVTLVIGAGPKLAAFAMAVRLLVNALPALAADWQQMLALLAILSMAVGNITAIAQSNLKRMLAYSAIAHMGFMLLGLLSGMVEGNWLNRDAAYSAALFYIIIYTVMSVGAFGMLCLLSRAGLDCENLEDMRGLNRRNPWYAALMLVLMLSLAGLPPTAGFYAKLAVFSAAVSAGYIWLAVAAVLLSLVGAYYYLRVVKLMYFDEPKEAAPATPAHGGVLMSVNGLALLLFGIVPGPLMDLCTVAIASL